MNRLILISIFIALSVAGRVTAQQAARSDDNSRGITGRLFNHNGQPLGGGKVFIAKLGVESRDYRETLTNDEGEFRFDDLSHGVYRLSAQGIDIEQMKEFYRPGASVILRMKKGGVITGTVTDSTGEPVIAARVQVLRVRDEQGRRIYNASNFMAWQAERLTDDRGVYRIWGLAPGSYLISVGGKDRDHRNPISDAIEDYAPTYHPSAATPSTAAEVTVNDGQEATGIDIRHRGESGYAISGHVTGARARGSNEEGVVVMLAQSGSNASLGWQRIQPGDGSGKFVFEGLADGEYELTALHLVYPNIDAASPQQRVIIKGKDVSVAEMKLAPLGSIDGRIALDAVRKPRCQNARDARPDETVIIVTKEGGDSPLPSFTLRAPHVRGTLAVPDRKGDFSIPALKAGHYRVDAKLSNEDLYIRSIQVSAAAQSRPLDAGRNAIALKSGERVTGLTINLQEGAASARGQVDASQLNATLPARLRVHLVPAERQESDNALRFAESAVESDGSFLLTNIAPGRYWLLARSVEDSMEDSYRPLAWDVKARLKLVQEAEAANNPIELQPCQRIGNHTLRYATTSKKTQ